MTLSIEENSGAVLQAVQSPMRDIRNLPHRLHRSGFGSEKERPSVEHMNFEVRQESQRGRSLIPPHAMHSCGKTHLPQRSRRRSKAEYFMPCIYDKRFPVAIAWADYREINLVYRGSSRRFQASIFERASSGVMAETSTDRSSSSTNSSSGKSWGTPGETA